MKIRTVVVAGAVAAVFGCASVGNQVLKGQTSESVTQTITKGSSTMSQVRQAFGDPTETTFTDGGNEIWKYQYTHREATALGYVPVVMRFFGGEDVDKKELVVLFDRAGVVVNYSMQESKQQVRRGTQQ